MARVRSPRGLNDTENTDLEARAERVAWVAELDKKEWNSYQIAEHLKDLYYPGKGKSSDWDELDQNVKGRYIRQVKTDLKAYKRLKSSRHPHLMLIEKTLPLYS